MSDKMYKNLSEKERQQQEDAQLRILDKNLGERLDIPKIKDD